MTLVSGSQSSEKNSHYKHHGQPNVDTILGVHVNKIALICSSIKLFVNLASRTLSLLEEKSFAVVLLSFVLIILFFRVRKICGVVTSILTFRNMMENLLDGSDVSITMLKLGGYFTVLQNT